MMESDSDTCPCPDPGPLFDQTIIPGHALKTSDRHKYFNQVWIDGTSYIVGDIVLLQLSDEPQTEPTGNDLDLHEALARIDSLWYCPFKQCYFFEARWFYRQYDELNRLSRRSREKLPANHMFEGPLELGEEQPVSTILAKLPHQQSPFQDGPKGAREVVVSMRAVHKQASDKFYLKPLDKYLFVQLPSRKAAYKLMEFPPYQPPPSPSPSPRKKDRQHALPHKPKLAKQQQSQPFSAAEAVTEPRTKPSKRTTEEASAAEEVEGVRHRKKAAVAGATTSSIASSGGPAKLKVNGVEKGEQQRQSKSRTESKPKKASSPASLTSKEAVNTRDKHHQKKTSQSSASSEQIGAKEQTKQAELAKPTKHTKPTIVTPVALSKHGSQTEHNIFETLNNNLDMLESETAGVSLNAASSPDTTQQQSKKAMSFLIISSDEEDEDGGDDDEVVAEDAGQEHVEQVSCDLGTCDAQSDATGMDESEDVGESAGIGESMDMGEDDDDELAGLTGDVGSGHDSSTTQPKPLTSAPRADSLRGPVAGKSRQSASSSLSSLVSPLPRAKPQAATVGRATMRRVAPKADEKQEIQQTSAHKPEQKVDERTVKKVAHCEIDQASEMDSQDRLVAEAKKLIQQQQHSRVVIDPRDAKRIKAQQLVAARSQIPSQLPASQESDDNGNDMMLAQPKYRRKPQKKSEAALEQQRQQPLQQPGVAYQRPEILPGSLSTSAPSVSSSRNAEKLHPTVVNHGTQDTLKPRAEPVQRITTTVPVAQMNAVGPGFDSDSEDDYGTRASLYARGRVSPPTPTPPRRHKAADADSLDKQDSVYDDASALSRQQSQSMQYDRWQPPVFMDKEQLPQASSWLAKLLRNSANASAYFEHAD
eukprot:m.292522 g.292522  ORF g.292522 m.292522 type:complete len:873 (+) comp15842_c1_seq1:149-2767(+)